MKGYLEGGVEGDVGFSAKDDTKEVESLIYK
jgi:hypothetical protein